MFLPPVVAVLPLIFARLGEAFCEAFNIDFADLGFDQGCLPPPIHAHTKVLQQRCGFFAVQAVGRRSGQRIGECCLVPPVTDRKYKASVRTDMRSRYNVIKR